MYRSLLIVDIRCVCIQYAWRVCVLEYVWLSWCEITHCPSDVTTVCPVCPGSTACGRAIGVAAMPLRRHENGWREH